MNGDKVEDGEKKGIRMRKERREGEEKRRVIREKRVLTSLQVL